MVLISKESNIFNALWSLLLRLTPAGRLCTIGWSLLSIKSLPICVFAHSTQYVKYTALFILGIINLFTCIFISICVKEIEEGLSKWTTALSEQAPDVSLSKSVTYKWINVGASVEIASACFPLCNSEAMLYQIVSEYAGTLSMCLWCFRIIEKFLKWWIYDLFMIHSDHITADSQRYTFLYREIYTQ